jgi:hypothetical protein
LIIKGGKLAASYSELMKSLWCKDDSYISPWELKRVIADKAS